MNVEKRTIISNYDGLNLELILLKPENMELIKGIVQISHGMTEHKKRYEEFMQYLAQHGFVTVIHDHRGHGSSVKSQEDLGYFYTRDYQALVEDLHQVTILMKEEYPGLPFFMIGHSMGSMISRIYLKKYDMELEKLVLTGPPTKNPAVGFGKMMARITEKFHGDHYRSKGLLLLTFGGYNKGIKQEHGWLCSDEKVVEVFNGDPKCNFIFTVNGFQILYELLRNSFSKTGWMLQNGNLPILILAGEQDPVIQNKRKLEALKVFLKGIGYRNTESKLYPDMRHEILNERGRKQVYEDIRKFFENDETEAKN